MNDISEKAGTLKKLFAGKKAGKILFVCGIAGIVLIFLSTLIPTSSAKKESAAKTASGTTEEYVSKLEDRLEETLSKIAGAGKCSVLITVERGTEYIYAKEENTTDDSSKSTTSGGEAAGTKSTGQQQYIIIDTDSGEQALLVTEIAPKIKGVVVVCQGAGNIDTAQQIKNAVTTALSITESKVCVSARAAQ